jgi:hypothetical protein
MGIAAGAALGFVFLIEPLKNSNRMDEKTSH